MPQLTVKAPIAPVYRPTIHLSILAPAHVISHYRMRGYEIIFVLK